MTGNPAHDDAIIEQVRKINLGHGEATVHMLEPFIRHLGYDDPGRELRRLKDADRLVSFKAGIYWARGTQYAQGLGKWV